MAHLQVNMLITAFMTNETWEGPLLREYANCLSLVCANAAPACFLVGPVVENYHKEQCLAMKTVSVLIDEHNKYMQLCQNTRESEGIRKGLQGKKKEERKQLSLWILNPHAIFLALNTEKGKRLWRNLETVSEEREVDIYINLRFKTTGEIVGSVSGTLRTCQRISQTNVENILQERWILPSFTCEFKIWS